MRTKYSIINMIVSIVNNFITLIAGYILQIVFVKTLGAEYLGVNGLFSNIITFLGLIELGVGTAIVYHLYKPVAENNEKEIAKLIRYYKKCYIIIAIIVLIIGISIMPFLPSIVGKISISENLNLIYLLILSEVVSSYLLSYKRTILYVNQKNYVANIFHIAYTIILNTIEILILITTKNFILYLLLKTIFKIAENLIISLYVDKNYKYIKLYNKYKIDDITKKDINKKVKALFTHKIGGYVVNGTDNILISKFFGIINVGIYSNYYLVTFGVSSLLSQIFLSVKASVGNLLVLENKEKCFDIYKKLNLANYWLYSICSIGFFLIIQPFIKFSYGSNYLFSISIVYAITFNFYLQGMRQSVAVYKEAAGIFYEDRYIPIIESIANIILSIVLAKYFGIIGIFLGTFLSGLLIHFYSYPAIVFPKVFDKKYSDYMILFLKQLVFFSISIIMINYINNLYIFDNNFIEFIKSGIIVIVLYNIIFILIYKKTPEFKYFISLIRKNKKKNKEVK